MAETKERRKTPRKLQAVTPKPDSNRRSEASADDIRRLIAEAAYYKAKERGFQPGHELEDWVQAESEVKQRVERST